MSGWIGVDLDGTLAHYEGWVSDQHIGEPVPRMLFLVKGWVAEGKDVRIFTARVADEERRAAALATIQMWCATHIGAVLPVTCKKDFSMIALYDDRCVQVETNTGRLIT